MKPTWALCLIPIACLAVSACNGKGEAKAPAGQVVATVDGQEITVRDLRAEMGGANYPDPVARRPLRLRRCSRSFRVSFWPRPPRSATSTRRRISHC